ncbi:LytR C-terminal domain-containing protein [candidate division WWE3 bacterium]|uniref:LytR C-terminal domain-containing protein n=1 Tax=candidate division WWE3 bacterium TaxID=2053526 RepID=A0A955ED30_UNCKA|nr:LytR C-terminal domain-containing protein [candidate division WWE3 bacterium]
MKQTVLIFLNKSKLEINLASQPKTISVTLAELGIVNQEIKNVDEFKEKLKNLIGVIETPPKDIILILDSSFIYTKDLTQVTTIAKEETSQAKEDEKREQISAFLDLIPFNTSKLTHKINNTEKGELLLVTNGELLHTMNIAFQELGWEIKAALPGLLLKDPQQEVNNSKLVTSINLFNNDSVTTAIQTTPNNSLKTKISIILVTLVLSGLGTGGYMYAKTQGYFVPKIKEAGVVNETPKPEMTSMEVKEELLREAQQIADEEDKKQIEKSKELKTELKVQILNGTNIAGVAGKTASAFIELGYVEKNVIADNAQETYEVTKVYVNNAVTEDLLEEIQNMLQLTFSDVVIEKLEDVEDIDTNADLESHIIVITGNQLTAEQQS